jgi:hypothetical protein
MVDYPCIPHPFAALQVYCYTFSLDLHVLGAPPAFVLSQDQTLIKVLLELDPRATSSIHLTLLISRSIQLSKNRFTLRNALSFPTRAAHFTMRA